MTTLDSDFPYSLTISLPLPTHRLASAALRTLQVDAELSPLVRRTFRLTRPQQPQAQSQAQSQSISETIPSSLSATTTTTTTTTTATQPPTLVPGPDSSVSNGAEGEGEGEGEGKEEELTVLQTEYRATTNRMLRVAVNGFMESLGVVLGVMEELDVDVLAGELGGV
ncbi:polarized growth chromatin-associated controller 1 [[Emmonsia] crescens]|uniref:Polarized growth chromatin-associated controller 1 n=2 Tax=[Emmonsia] crescens TaxID=73230 RepID=A0A2B7ZPB7_9EURO|nr:polarized growth chromatin-associated controller 1 [Emmonsia crescens]